MRPVSCFGPISKTGVVGNLVERIGSGSAPKEEFRGQWVSAGANPNRDFAVKHYPTYFAVRRAVTKMLRIAWEEWRNG